MKYCYYIIYSFNFKLYYFWYAGGVVIQCKSYENSFYCSISPSTYRGTMKTKRTEVLLRQVHTQHIFSKKPLRLHIELSARGEQQLVFGVIRRVAANISRRTRVDEEHRAVSCLAQKKNSSFDSTCRSTVVLLNAHHTCLVPTANTSDKSTRTPR